MIIIHDVTLWYKYNLLVHVISSLKLRFATDNRFLWTVSVIEHKELNAVWTELLNSWGNEIYMKVRVLDMSASNSLLSTYLFRK